jgi:hypothetical protein
MTEQYFDVTLRNEMEGCGLVSSGSELTTGLHSNEHSNSLRVP